MTTLQDTAVRTRTIIVGVIDDRWAGALAYALGTALSEPAAVRVVRVSTHCASSRVELALPICTVDVEGDPLDALLVESRRADLMVVQSPKDDGEAQSHPVLNGLREGAATLLVEVDEDGGIVRASGTNGWRYVAEPQTTFAMPAAPAEEEHVICVGVDASPASDAAVAWAVAMAARSSSTIRLISVFGTDRQRTQEHARDDLARAAGTVDDADTDFVLTQGEPAERLIGASSGTAMLVLGRHGTQGLIHSALGSVGETCARLADCPVVIVPAR